MTSNTIRKAIGVVKDQTSIGIAKVAGNVSPDLEILMVKATSHDEEPSGEKYVREIVSLTSLCRGNADACMAGISKRLGRTRDWKVALKAVMVFHRLMADAGLGFQEEILLAKRRGTRILNLWGFKDVEAYSHSWDHSRFVRAYASYLDQKVDFIAYQRRLSFGLIGGGCSSKTDDELYYMRNNKEVMKPERVLEKAIQLQRLVGRFLACRPMGEANNSRLVLIGMRLIVNESFKLYADLCQALDILLDRFPEMEYKECVVVLEVYVAASKQVVELEEFYGWCQDTGVFSSSSDQYPRVHRITGKLLETLEGSLKERAKRPSRSTSNDEEEEGEIPHQLVVDANANANCATPPSPNPESTPKMMMPQPPKEEADEALMNLWDDHNGPTADEHSNIMDLALFSEAPNNSVIGSWEAFPSNGGEAGVTSAWQAPAAESGKANWELDLVESASNLSKQKSALAGGFDQLLLNGLYEQGGVRQEVSSVQLGNWSTSSVALPGRGMGAVPLLPLPAPDGTVQGYRAAAPIFGFPVGSTSLLCADSRHGEEATPAGAGAANFAAIWE